MYRGPKALISRGCEPPEVAARDRGDWLREDPGRLHADQGGRKAGTGQLMGLFPQKACQFQGIIGLLERGLGLIYGRYRGRNTLVLFDSFKEEQIDRLRAPFNGL